MMIEEKAAALLQLHEDDAILSVVNVWDAISAKVVAETPGTTALATASHSISATLGYPDGEVIPFEEHLMMIRRIVATTNLPVSADLEAGYGDAAEAVRRAIGVGVVGANIEDQMKPIAEATRIVESVMAAGDREGIRFVLNARTDAFVRAGDRDPGAVLDDAIERGQAYLQAGAPVVFVPGKLNEAQVRALVDAFGPRRLTMIGVPGSLSRDRLQELGVARISYGPWSQRVALTALQDLTATVAAGGGLPEGTKTLN
ncbi:isocitrate lyase/phosphoenolpyruvate mutase family protein [Microbacterium mitrae]|uniref:Isocitrate lyase/phosphoenolpyruvate mutase family protein n=1 Tax=Microbacterium mitrae TaxID=664640 RepID=A0A5C8HQY1_9MICO|nr:isocitrate lyase/phosphoenolpyruvate mutase family protein [Microbacterium mitrae]TXK05927.1 isocitrate lyase/phosphoenolpyruvate mutase family protein [Microbacterium mitrae]